MEMNFLIKGAKEVLITIDDVLRIQIHHKGYTIFLGRVFSSSAAVDVS